LFEQTEIASYQAAHDVSRPLNQLSKSKREAVLSETCFNLIQAYQASVAPLQGPAPAGEMARLFGEERKEKTSVHASKIVPDMPIFRLRSDGFEGGDDAALLLVIRALERVSAGLGRPFVLELPDIDENVDRIRALQALPRRSERESIELVQRIQSDQQNRKDLTILEYCFNLVLTNEVFRKTAELNDIGTWELLTGLRIQLWRQLGLNKRKSMNLTTTVTDRVSRDVLMTPAEYAECSRWFDDAAGERRQGLVRGTRYELNWFAPTFVHHRCHATIAICIAQAMATKEGALPKNVIESATDLTTWRISRGWD